MDSPVSVKYPTCVVKISFGRWQQALLVLIPSSYVKYPTCEFRFFRWHQTALPCVNMDSPVSVKYPTCVVKISFSRSQKALLVLIPSSYVKYPTCAISILQVAPDCSAVCEHGQPSFREIRNLRSQNIVWQVAAGSISFNPLQLREIPNLRNFDSSGATRLSACVSSQNIVWQGSRLY